jgi:acetyl-CoA carboxylase carboxyltransferase component
LPYRAEDDNPALLVQAGAEESDARARKVIDALTDASTQFELRPRWAPEVITTLSRIGGQSVGILATDPGIAGGKVTVDGCDKIARYIALCDAYQIPVVFLVDSAGVDDESGNAMFRHAARIPIAIANARIPIVTLIIGEVGGIMQALLGGFGSVLEGAPHLMWPGARAWGLGLSSEVGEGSSFELARWFVTDDVIHPAETRARLLALLSAPRKDRQTRRFITPW